MNNDLHELLNVSSFRPIALVIFIEVFGYPSEECWWFNMQEILNNSVVLRSIYAC